GLFWGGLIYGLVGAMYWVGVAILIAAVFSMRSSGRLLLVAAAAVVIGLLPAYGIMQCVSTASLLPLVSSFQYFAYGLLGIQIVSSVLAVTPVRH
ncbi:MAG: hypothetical protein MI861_14485, partial [Pirellulales bacterium]|nr:hypothetical protein [Pirellulales bacterium]